MTTYCAPCITDLALVREAVTAVGGTASCMAHAVLLVHPTDDPGRRRQRLGQLRDLAAVKAETASQEEQAQLELLVHEYGLASAMDMGGARRKPEDPPRRTGKSRRGRERPGRPEGGRPEGGRPEGGRPPGGPGTESAAATGDGAAATQAATQAASNGDDPAPVMPGSGDRAGLPPSTPAPSTPATSAPETAGSDAAAAAPAPAAPSQDAPAAPSQDAPAAPSQDAPAAPSAPAAPEPSGAALPTAPAPYAAPSAPAGDSAPQAPRPGGDAPSDAGAPSSAPAQD